MENILNVLKEDEVKLVKTIKCSKGKVIFSEHEECSCIGIVKSGRVIISSVTMNGNEIVYNTLNPGDIFGNNLIFSSDPKFRGDVIALEESEIGVIDKETLIKFLQENKLFLLKYLEVQSNFGKALNLKLKLLSFNNAYDRLMYYFEINNNVIKYDNISSLSKKLFLQRETLSRLISKLEKQKYLSKNKSFLTLHKK